MTAIRRVGVVGAGLMGSGIAQACATAGYDTTLVDARAEALPVARAGIETSLAKFVEKGKLAAADRDAALARLTITEFTAAVHDADLIIEAIVENLEMKNLLWHGLDVECPAHTIFASNTSSLGIAQMAAATRRGDRFVGLHFFNPVPMMPLVEVVRTVTTSTASFETAFAFAQSLGKTAIAAKDQSGFIVNLLLVPFMLDAVRALERGVASIADIDSGMQLGAGHPMGPLTLLDFVGLDTCAQIAEIMFDEYRDARYAPPPLLRRMVTCGYYGKKNGRGFYDWSKQPPVPSELGL